MSSPKSSSRRGFLRDAGLILGGSLLASRLPPLEAMGKIATEAFFSKAGAATDYSRYFVNINLFGAPNRWIFDHWLRTKPGQTINANPMVTTRMSGGSVYNEAVYATVNYKGVEVTPMWLTNAIGANGERSLSDLLDHMIVVRGYGSGQDGHPANLVRQTRPLNSLGSTSGYLAEQSTNLLRAVQYPASNLTGYASQQGVGMTMLHDRSYSNGHNLSEDLLFPFGARNGLEDLQKLRTRYDNVLAKARFELKQRSLASSADSVAVDNESALKIIREGLDHLVTAWPALFAKYERIIMGTLRQRGVPGFSDKPVAALGDDMSGDSPYGIDANADTYYMQPDHDLRSCFDSAVATRLIQSFALAEFVLTNKLSSVMEISMLNIDNLMAVFRRVTHMPNSPFANPTSMAFGYQTDQHRTGAVPATFMNAAIYRALASSILELTDRLKATPNGAGNMFDQTVIQVLQEFGRSPRITGGGSDHGWDNMVTSLFTGMHKLGPKVVGNISKTQTYNDFYAGTFGYKAPVVLHGQTVVPSPLHLASSMSSLLGLHHNPWGNLARPLFTESNGVITFHVGDDIV